MDRDGCAGEPVADQEVLGHRSDADPRAVSPDPGERTEPGFDEVDEWGIESFPASDPPQH